MEIKYGLIGKWINAGEIAGFFIIDDNNKKAFISKDKAIQLAENGMLVNWEALTDDNGNKYLVGKDLNLRDIPTMINEEFDSIKIITKVLKNDKLFGYVCIDNNGNKHNFKANKVWEIAKTGKIEGIKTKRSSTNRILESNDMALRKIGTIKI